MDEARNLFVTDARDLVEKLYRDLEQLRIMRTQGRQRRELAGRIFRRVHTLKGSAGSLGLKSVSTIAHEMEGVLDGVRLGRLDLGEELIDLLEAAADAITQALDSESSEDFLPTARKLIDRLKALSATSDKQETTADSLRHALPTYIAQSLSEYDLQHAREAVREGSRLFIVTARFGIAEFDHAFREVSKLLGQAGEIIATVPGESAADDEISFRLLYATELISNELLRRASELGRIEVIDVNIDRSDAAHPAMSAGLNQPAFAGMVPSVRVELEELDGLISDSSELFRDTNNALLSLAGPENKTIVNATAARLRRRFVELEERLIKLRLVPLADVLEQAAARGGRMTARQLGKEVEFEILGGEVGIDRSLADAIAEPLQHLVRNAVDHGIEAKADRLAAGKNAIGRVKLSAFTEGSRIHISVSDDGRGIDFARVAATANDQGIADLGPGFTRDQCLRLIFRPGFSTAEEVSELSGRGVGLEVVDRAMELTAGVVRVASEAGAGTTFNLIVPATLALVHCLVVRSMEQLYCIESARIFDRGLLSAREVNELNGKGAFEWKGEQLPLQNLREMLSQPAVLDTNRQHGVIVWQSIDRRGAALDRPHRLALIVDDVIGQQEMLVRSLGRHATRWQGIAGAAEMLDGNVAFVLDVEQLIEAASED
jgi:two-component system chemotaxis sensor kinase CheA